MFMFFISNPGCFPKKDFQVGDYGDCGSAGGEGRQQKRKRGIQGRKDIKGKSTTFY